jgi:predicted enzyme related to lactoylglutathione lyase
MANALNWFEIPATDMDRATSFYNTVLGCELQPWEMPDGSVMAMFPAEDGVGGAVIQGEGYTPSAEGSIIYLNAGADLSDALGRVEAAGGQVVLPKTDIGENGYVAYLLDTEGNKVGLHSMD